jgi:hypothetical protein
MAIGFLVYGHGSGTVEVPAGAEYSCAVCKSVTSHRLLVNYEFIHLFVWFKDVRKRTLLRRCARCGATNSLTPDEAKLAGKSIGTDPIPLRDRYGGVKLFLLIAGFVSLINLLASPP